MTLFYSFLCYLPFFLPLITPTRCSLAHRASLHSRFPSNMTDAERRQALGYLGRSLQLSDELQRRAYNIFSGKPQRNERPFVLPVLITSKIQSSNEGDNKDGEEGEASAAVVGSQPDSPRAEGKRGGRQDAAAAGPNEGCEVETGDTFGAAAKVRAEIGCAAGQTMADNGQPAEPAGRRTGSAAEDEEEHYDEINIETCETGTDGAKGDSSTAVDGAKGSAGGEAL
jgi:hypothetical protein